VYRPRLTRSARRRSFGASLRRSVVAALALVVALVGASSSHAQTLPPKQAVAVGRGGAAASVDPVATRAAIDVLRHGGNAVDAAVAAAAMLGVVEPYSCGIGGGGFMVVYRAGDRRVVTIDSREKAPAAYRPDIFLDPATGTAYPFSELVTSGLGVGVPGTVRSWSKALRLYGTRSLASMLRPAIRTAENGFFVDQTFFDQTLSNQDRFRDFTTTRAVFLTPTGDPFPVGSIFRNPDMAASYRQIAAPGGVNAFYRGAIADAIVDAVQNPPTAPGTTRNVRPGLMTKQDLAAYTAPNRRPALMHYRGLTMYGMGPPSSGGSTVGEALNILEGYDLAATPRPQALHYYIESAGLSYADRNRYLGDPDFVFVPLQGLLTDSFAAERRALIGPTAAPKPFPPGDPTDNEGPSTTHLTVADRWGNVVSYTFTIEQTGGSGIVPRGTGLDTPNGTAGFLLNNELTDFETAPGLANSPAANKRPRSSMSPTILLRSGRPRLALGSPGGATIITTVLQTLINRLDFGMSLADAIAAPRASPRNSATIQAEPAFIASDGPALQALGHAFSSVSEIGAATGIEFMPGGVVHAAAEPVRRGGGDARALDQSPGRRCGGGVTVLGRLRAGSRLFVKAEIRLLGTPAAGRRIVLRGAGVRATGVTNRRGIAVIRVRTRRPGVFVVAVRNEPCATRFTIRPVGAVAGALTGRGL
jgi:gamma-glutamyltranspeptidase / glutathione hydrolase